MGKNCKFLHIPNRCKIEQPDTGQLMGLKIRKQKCARGSSFVEIT